MPTIVKQNGNHYQKILMLIGNEVMNLSLYTERIIAYNGFKLEYSIEFLAQTLIYLKELHQNRY